MSLATSARSIGLFQPGLLGMAGQGISYTSLTLQDTARSDLTLSVATGSGADGDAEAKWLICSEGMGDPFAHSCLEAACVIV